MSSCKMLKKKALVVKSRELGIRQAGLKILALCLLAV